MNSNNIRFTEVFTSEEQYRQLFELLNEFEDLWRQFGANLNIPHHKLNLIGNTSHAENPAKGVIYHWKNSSEATVDVLLNALEHCYTARYYVQGEIDKYWQRKFGNDTNKDTSMKNIADTAQRNNNCEILTTQQSRQISNETAVNAAETDILLPQQTSKSKRAIFQNICGTIFDTFDIALIVLTVVCIILPSFDFGLFTICYLLSRLISTLLVIFKIYANAEKFPERHVTDLENLVLLAGGTSLVLLMLSVTYFYVLIFGIGAVLHAVPMMFLQLNPQVLQEKSHKFRRLLLSLSFYYAAHALIFALVIIDIADPSGYSKAVLGPLSIEFYFLLAKRCLESFDLKKSKDDDPENNHTDLERSMPKTRNSLYFTFLVAIASFCIVSSEFSLFLGLIKKSRKNFNILFIVVQGAMIFQCALMACCQSLLHLQFRKPSVGGAHISESVEIIVLLGSWLAIIGGTTGLNDLWEYSNLTYLAFGISTIADTSQAFMLMFLVRGSSRFSFGVSMFAMVNNLMLWIFQVFQAYNTNRNESWLLLIVIFRFHCAIKWSQFMH